MLGNCHNLLPQHYENMTIITAVAHDLGVALKCTLAVCFKLGFFPEKELKT